MPVDGSAALELTAGDYNDVYLGIELYDDGASPAIVATGTYETTTGQVRPLRFEFNSGVVFEAEAGSATVDAGTAAIAKVTIAPAQWFAGVSAARLDNANVNANGVIVVSETSNASIFDTVADALDRSIDARFL